MSGIGAQRGFIFQSLIAMIECLERTDWDAIKLEPQTTNDKVDIQLSRGGKILTAIQVKSAQSAFSQPEVERWLSELRADSGNANEIRLILVGDEYSANCDDYISQNSKEIKKAPFADLESLCLGKLTTYVKNAGLARQVRVSDLGLIDASLFSEIHRNSIATEALSREAFEEAFRRALPFHGIPKTLTPIPAVNQTVGLVGRETVMKTVFALLEDKSRPSLVNGLGGIGKTAVMQWVCNDFKNKGNYVAWIDCRSSLKEDLLALTDSLGITEKDPTLAYKMVLDAVKTQLDGALYLFMDNLTYELSNEELRDLNSLNAHIMVTSRQKYDAFPAVDLDVLEPEDALTMFFKYYNEDSDRQYESAAREIVNSAHRHTLLVELLAKAARKSGGTLERFSERLAKEGVFDVFTRKLKTSHDVNENLTIEECVMKLYAFSHLTEEQQRIMKLFSIFTPEKEIYWEVAEWAELDMDAVDELVELAWLGRSGAENNYTIHQIVRDSLRRQFQKHNSEVKLEEYGDLLSRIARTNNYMPQNFNYTKVRERLVMAEDIVKNLACRTDRMMEAENISKDSALLEKAAVLYSHSAEVFYAQGDYVKAQKYFEKSLAIFERVLGADNPKTSNTYNNLGVLYKIRGEDDKALKFYEKALATRERLSGPTHPEMALTYNNIANLYAGRREFDMALDHYRKALDIYMEVFEEENPSIARTYHNMANVLFTQNQHEDALKYYKKSLAIRERMLGTNHPETASTHLSMGSLFQSHGEYVKALDSLRKALAIYEKVSGPDHPSTARAYYNIAMVFQKQKKYEKALEYYRDAFYIQVSKLGKDHRETQTTLKSMNIVESLIAGRQS